MQSLDNAAPTPLPTAHAPSVQASMPQRSGAATGVLVIPAHADLLLLRPPTGGSSVGGDADLVVPFEAAAVAAHATALTAGLRGAAPPLHEVLRHGVHQARDDHARHALAELPIFLQAPGAPDPDAPQEHASHAADIVQRAIARLLLVLSGEDGARLERRDGRTAVDRACGFMVTHIPEALSLEDVVRATDISARTLQYGFLDRYGMSPMRWLREQRLRRLHAALLDAPADRGVTELATALGFTHLGRLGRTFEQRFGLLPSRLLRRARVG